MKNLLKVALSYAKMWTCLAVAGAGTYLKPEVIVWIGQQFGIEIPGPVADAAVVFLTALAVWLVPNKSGVS